MELTSIYEKINYLIQQKIRFWVATIIKSDGSVPGQTGMKLIVVSENEIYGTIGGGNIEHYVIKKILKYKPNDLQIWDFALSQDPDEIKESLGMLCGGQQQVLIEPVNLKEKLFIFGAGHCAISLSAIASKCGFDVYVLDNRDEWLNEKYHPLATQLIKSNFQHFDETIIPDNSFIVIMTYAHTYDEILLKKLLNKKSKYFGMIGSRNKIKKIFDDLIKEGYDKELLKKVYAPIGFELNTHTPDEIAVSISAQLLAVKNGITSIAINSNPLLENN